MKKLFFILRGLPFLAIFFCFTQCKKELNSSNIILYNKPLSVIQSCIQGKWKCLYGKGGISANMVQYYDDYYWTFTSDNKVIQVYKGNTLADTTINWIWDTGTYTSGDSTFTMKFYDNQNVPWVYVIDRIVNDTLILHDNSSDAVFYHFIKL